MNKISFKFVFRGRICKLSIAIGRCVTDWVDKTNITAPLDNDRVPLWQITATSYSIGQTVSNRPFKILFTSTTPDISVPKNAFNEINLELKAKVDDWNGNAFDCDNRYKAQGITVTISGQKIILNGGLYTEKIKDKCYLRIRPNNEDFWVFGLNFYNHYATCFKPNGMEIQFNKNVAPVMMTDYEMVDKDVAVDGDQIITKTYKRN